MQIRHPRPLEVKLYHLAGIRLRSILLSKDKRSNGNYTLVPRGRVFEFKDVGYVVFTGEWIDNCPEAKDLILFEFNLPEDKTEFRKDSHWDIGHGWSQEFI